MRYLSLFSGIEAATVAWDSLGWTPIAFAEIDPFCCEILKQKYPAVPNLGDVRKIDGKTYRGKFDLLVGGSPCQSVSTAGRREGMAGESGLVTEFTRILGETLPEWFVWENVPGALSQEGGLFFRELLQTWTDLGYGVAWRICDSQYWGVPQRRRRVFAVGHLGDFQSAAQVLFEPESLLGDSATSRAKRETSATASREESQKIPPPRAYCINGGTTSPTGRLNARGGVSAETCYALSRSAIHIVAEKQDHDIMEQK